THLSLSSCMSPASPTLTSVHWPKSDINPRRWGVPGGVPDALVLGTRFRRHGDPPIEGTRITAADRLDTRPTHPRATDPDDPLHKARAAETTSLWRLKHTR